MTKYILRLDDAYESMDSNKWDRIEELLDRFSIKPLVGVIPECEDPKLKKLGKYPEFWKKITDWQKKGWVIAMHGLHHVYETKSGGINPVHKRSEFAGLSLKEQEEKIAKSKEIFDRHNVETKVFFSPSHTFDESTLLALKNKTDIRIISDTIAFKPYRKYDFTFVPQQSGKCRRLRHGVYTFCYHPNTMTDTDFERLFNFLEKYNQLFISFPLEETKRKLSFFDRVYRSLYLLRRKLK